MSNMKKMISLAAIGAIVALAAPAYADMLTNRIAANGIIANKLASNKLASNKLASNKLASNKLAVNGIIANGIRSKELGVAAAAGEGAVDDIVGVKLPDGTTFIR